MTDDSLRLISWNIGGRVKKNPDQVEALRERQPDVIALQEVRLNALNNFKKLLPDLGLRHTVESVNLAVEHDRVYGELIASRWPVKCIPTTDEQTPYPERVLSARIDSPWGGIELHTAHVVPGSSCGWKKIDMFEGIYRRLARESATPRILCGDFNSPQLETPDGRLVTWGQKIKPNGEVVVQDGYEDWDAGERGVLEGLAKYDLADVFRRINGYEVDAFSWRMKRKGKVVAERRFDHIFASSDLNPVECRYIYDPLDHGLSDHAAMEAFFAPVMK
ncbi:MAG: endonuclease/exonuclease/phosphatase family protein [bacterium]